MKTDKVYSVLIVDDNPSIHQDFRKILLNPDEASELDVAEEMLFSTENETKDKDGKSAIKASLPSVCIDSAYQGKEAVEMVKNKVANGEQYAIAFVDIRMPPGWDGIMTIGKMWDVDPDIQVVICSAYSDYTWHEIATLLGESDKLLVLKKPFDIIEVRQIATALLKKWDLTKEVNARIKNLHDEVAEKNVELEKYLSLVRATLESTKDGIAVFNKDMMLVDFNKKFAELWEIPIDFIQVDKSKEIIEHLAKAMKEPDKIKTLFDKTKTNSKDENSENLELKNGSCLECFVRPQYLNEDIVGHVWSFRDITEYIAMQTRLAYQATHDSLTGLSNRCLLIDRLSLAMEYSNRNNNQCAVFFIDLDKFKQINDQWGHEFGDKLLIEFSKIVKSSIRKIDILSRDSEDLDTHPPELNTEDVVARMGGDEFILVLGALKDKLDSVTVYNRLVEALSNPIEIGTQKFQVTFSVGISVFPEDGTTVTELLKNADIAMYQAKRAGGNQLKFYNESMNDDAKKRLQLEKELKDALKNNEFLLEFQPEYELESNKILSFEALIRWKHPRLGLVPPMEFIPVAEELGIIPEISQWVMTTAFTAAQVWEKKGLGKYNIAINISSQELRYHNFVTNFEKAIQDSGLSPERIEFEISEAIILENNYAVTDKIRQIKGKGVKFVIDDFGKGYSSLSYLSRFSADKIKIAYSFLEAITSNSNLQQAQETPVIQAIIAIGSSMNIPVLAVGIENAVQLQYLKESGCPQGQGYYLQKPISGHDIEDFLRKS